jgi:hypothetical protein
VATATSYYRYRQWVNCAGGGYVEDYNLLLGLGAPGVLPSVQALNAVKSILCLRGQLLEGNSKIANGEISIETLPGQNPPEGFQIPHNVSNSQPVVLNDPTTGTVEVAIGIANDQEQCIAFRLNTNSGFTELRTLRSIRATWVNQWPVLLNNIQTQLGIWGAALPAAGTLITSYPAGINNPAGMIAYFMLVVMVNTNLVQEKPLPTSVTSFNILPFATPSSSGSPAVVNPILVPTLARRKVGEGWPKTRGKMQTFGTNG